jgi:tetratricopeptide (TPR) repeat protein
MKSQSGLNGKESAGLQYSDNFLQALQRYQEDPGFMNGPYWSMIADWVSGMVSAPEKFSIQLTEIEDLIDYGICTEVAGSTPEIRSMVNDAARVGYSLNILLFSDWLNSLFSKIMQGDRKEVLEKELHRCELQKKNRSRELENLQIERKSKVLNLLDEPTRKAKGKLVDDLVKMDDLMYSSLQMKKAIALGTFFSVTQKREHFDREKQLQKEVNWFNNFIDSQANKEGITEAHKIQDKVIETLSAIIEIEVVIEKVKSDILAIEKLKQEVSPAEIESRIRKEIEYMRDLSKLAAMRLKLAPCPLLTVEQKFFTIGKIKESYDRIQEFDPEVFHNDRVSMFGKPSVLLIPGTGASVFDWKNNMLIVPMVIPGNNPTASIATGIVDYRLDVDEDRTFMTSYNQIAERKTVRSTVELRNLLTKDYVAWMTSEYNGFRVLSKLIKDWFEHSVAPSKNEIFTPSEYRTFALSPTEFEKQFKEIEEKMQQGDIGAVDNSFLWSGSILYYQKGIFEKSLELLKVLLVRSPDPGIIWYNAGMVAMKLMRKPEAIDYFTQYANKYPQTWWARIARDHLRRLQM